MVTKFHCRYSGIENLLSPSFRLFAPVSYVFDCIAIGPLPKMVQVHCHFCWCNLPSLQTLLKSCWYNLLPGLHPLLPIAPSVQHMVKATNGRVFRVCSPLLFLFLTHAIGVKKNSIPGMEPIEFIFHLSSVIPPDKKKIELKM